MRNKDAIVVKRRSATTAVSVPSIGQPGTTVITPTSPTTISNAHIGRGLRGNLSATMNNVFVGLVKYLLE